MPTRLMSYYGYLLRRGLVPEDAVGEAGVLEVVPADVVERLGAVGRPHAVHLHDDEAQVGQRRRTAGSG